MSTPNQRILHALAAIEFVAGEDERASVEAQLTPQDRQTFGDDLHIGGFRGGIGFLKSNTETLRRNLVRAILLTELAQGKLKRQQVGGARTDLLGLSAAQLEDQLRKLFPYKPYAGSFARRADWAPRFFTDPWLHNNGNYMYVVHSIMRDASQVGDVLKVGATQSELEAFNKLRNQYIGYGRVDEGNPRRRILNVSFCRKYLDNPDILKQNIISSSVINHNKHSTYYPFGFILRVPPECVYITSPRDVSVKNRTDDILAEFAMRSGLQQNKVRSPQDILANTTGLHGDTGYNEIVLVGTSPEGKQVDVIGLFVKTAGNGNLYIRNRGGVADKTGAYVNKDLQAAITDCARKFHLPIVPIVDTTSAASNAAWPFRNLHGNRDIQLPQRARTRSI